MNTPHWHLVTSAELLALPRPTQFASLAVAYLRSAQQLCDALISAPAQASFERAAVVLYLSAHAVELFLKGAILRRAPDDRLGHDLDPIYKRYRSLFPSPRFDFSVPFATEYPGMSKAEIAEAKHHLPEPSELYRYPVDRLGQPWEIALGFEVASFRIALAALDADFARVLAEFDG